MKKVYVDLTWEQLQVLKTGDQLEVSQEHYITDEQGNMTKEMIEVIVYNAKRDQI